MAGDVTTSMGAAPAPPAARLLWTAEIDIGPLRALGPGPRGERFIVPILGGSFTAAPGVDGLTGTVLPGGADRQCLRPDGVKELDALYEMQSDDGIVLTIRNRVLIDDARQPERYATSVLSATAPDGPLAWLNRRVLVGTLQVLRPAREAVRVRAWEIDGAPVTR